MKRFHVFCSAFALAAVALTSVAEAQPGRGGRGGGGGLTQLLSIEAVVEELELTEDQVADAKKLGENFAVERREAIEEASDGFDFRNASEEERAEYMTKMQEVGAKLLKKERESLNGVLLDHQIERLEQLRVQQLGSRAISDASVVEKLKITDEQKEKLQKIAEDSQAKMRELFTGGNREGMREKMTEIGEAAQKEVMAVLTKKQKATLEELAGDKFEFPERQRGDRGGDRGGDGGGDRRRPDADDTN